MLTWQSSVTFGRYSTIVSQSFATHTYELPAFSVLRLFPNMDTGTDSAFEDHRDKLFVPSEWIGCGKTYPEDDTPSFIIAARKSVLTIPQKHQRLLPDPKLSVLGLLAAELPLRPSAVTHQEASRAFSFDPPTEDLPAIRTRPLPHPQFVQKLQKAFGQAWFSGALSIVDGRFKDSRLPLYVITYWMEMTFIYEKKACWLQADVWLRRYEGRDDALVQEGELVRVSMGSLAWGLRLKALEADTGADTLAGLLSDQWLNDEHINMLFEELYSRVRLNTSLRKKAVVFPLTFQAVMRNAVLKNTYDHKLLGQCRHFVKSGRTKIYFPVNVEQSHWVPCMIDLETDQLRYGEQCHNADKNLCSSPQAGDSLSAAYGPRKPAFARIVKDVLTVVLSVLGRQIHDGGNTLAHGEQEDSHSCGICTVNAVDHALFKTELFVHRQRRRWRAYYFNKLVRAHNDRVSMVYV